MVCGKVMFSQLSVGTERGQEVLHLGQVKFVIATKLQLSLLHQFVTVQKALTRGHFFETLVVSGVWCGVLWGSGLC